jgi:hypothetical protein
MATALTIAGKTADDSTIYFDGTTSNVVTFIVSSAGTPLGGVDISGTLATSAAPVTPAGAVQVLTKSNPAGEVRLKLTPVSAGSLTLTLLETSTPANFGTTPVTVTMLKPITVDIDPTILAAPGSVVATANILDASTGAKAANIPLHWLDTSVPPSFPTTLDTTTDPATPSTYEYTSDALTLQQIDDLQQASIPLQLTVGPKISGIVVQRPVPTLPPLLAPEIQAPSGTTPIVDDDYITAVMDTGVPFLIPPITNAIEKNLVMMYASQTNDATAPDAPVLATYLLGPDDVGEPLMIYVSATNAVFTQNGPWYVFYRVHTGRTQNLTYSEVENILVQRSVVAGSPDGTPDSSLNKPLVTPSVYAVDDYTSNQTLDATIPFLGTYKPAQGDQITAVISLTGYTLANYNYVIRRATPTYTLGPNDFDQRQNYISKKLSFTPSQLASIDGSNGEVYFLVQPAAGGPVKRSPSRNMIVDTVPAYSGSYVDMMFK